MDPRPRVTIKSLANLSDSGKSSSSVHGAQHINTQYSVFHPNRQVTHQVDFPSAQRVTDAGKSGVYAVVQERGAPLQVANGEHHTVVAHFQRSNVVNNVVPTANKCSRVRLEYWSQAAGGTCKKSGF